MMKKICVSIINYNGKENTDECIDSIAKCNISEIDLSVVIVDNASVKPYSLPKVKYTFPIEVIYNSENTGFAGGHNRGIAFGLEKGADYILILNNDTFVDKDFLNELSQTLEEEKIGIASPKIYFAKGSEFHKDKYDSKDLGHVIWYAGGIMDWANVLGKHLGVDEVDKGQYDKQTETDFASGCCMLIKREVFEKVGNFDERYFLYYEDSDLNERAKLAGFLTFYNPMSKIWHKNAASTGGSGSELQDYFISRNRLLFGYRYASLRAKSALFKESLHLLKHGRKWQKKGVKDYYLRKFGKGSYT